MRRFGLTNNQLKLLALVTMTVDHMGYILFPHSVLLRAVGRLAYPIYAYMIAEGCRHTRSLPKYFGALALMAAVCQSVYFLVMGSLYQYIMVTFTLSVGQIILIKHAMEKRSRASWCLAALGVAAILCITEILPRLSGTDFDVDYGFWGVMLPVCVYLVPNKPAKLAATTLCLSMIALGQVTLQWLSLLALIPLALYNGQRGKWNIKWIFYLYYPLHLVALYGIASLVR